MKRLTLFLSMLIIFSTALFAQKSVTKFLGIPIDGTKTAMTQKLKAKGFRNSPTFKGFLTGEFNGEKVNIEIQTNNYKVWRIAVLYDYQTTDESQIKVRYNNLCYQFCNNEKYFSLKKYADLEIPDDEDISYEMNVHNKNYESAFYQIDKKNVEKSFERFKKKHPSVDINNLDGEPESIKKEVEAIVLDSYNEMRNRQVWFNISNTYGNYSITLFYENLYNQAHGEDL